MTSKYYLARSGDVFGPYTEEDILALERRGEIFKYTWIWKPNDNAWKALDPAPLKDPTQTSQSQVLLDTKEVYCLVGQHIVKGELRNATELGFEMKLQNHEIQSYLGKGMPIQVLRAADSTGLAGHLQEMKILEMTREDKNWVIFLRHR